MRIREIIVEYDRGMTLKSWEQKLTTRMANDQAAPETIDEIMEMIESADPTNNKIYTQWIVKCYTNSQFSVVELDQVKELLSKYDKIKKLLTDTTHKDINRVSYTQLPEIIKMGELQQSNPKFEIIPDTEVLYNGPEGQLAIPKTEEASRALGSGTAWCTAYTNRPTQFSYYNTSGNIYTWRDKNGDRAQFFWGDTIQFMNSANDALSPKKMQFYRSINPATSKLFAKYENKFLNSPDKNRVARILELAEALKESGVKWEGAKEILIDEDNAEKAFKFADKNRKKITPDIEATIAKSAKWSVMYAKRVLNREFPVGEDIISGSAEDACNYATQVLKRKFPAGEAAIARSAEHACDYAISALKDKFPAGERAISISAEYSTRYAMFVIEGKFPAGEAAIASNAENSLEYAKYALHDRFPAGEQAIAKDSYIKNEYQSDIINGVWGKGIDAIAANPRSAHEYALLIEKRFPAGEAAIATDPRLAADYDARFGTNLAQQ